MGLGKIINCFGVYNFFSNDVREFARNLSAKFGVGISVMSYISDEIKFSDSLHEGLDAEFEINSDSSLKYRLYARFVLRDSINHSFASEDSFLLNYTLFLPGEAIGEENVQIEFYPSSVFEVWHIPYSNSWSLFLAVISEDHCHYYGSWELYRDYINEIREWLIAALKILNCSQVLYLTNGNYNFDEKRLLIQDEFLVTNMKQLKSIIIESDGIIFFDFIEIFGGKPLPISTSIKDLEIGFVDDVLRPLEKWVN